MEARRYNLCLRLWKKETLLVASKRKGKSMKIYIETMGCPKNFVDSEMLMGLLVNDGHELVNEEKEAECILINTCGFINDAKIESIDKIFEAAKLGKILVVTGCLSQRYGEELYVEIPEIDIITGVNNYKEISKLLLEREKNIQTGKTNKKAKLLDEHSRENDLYGEDDSIWQGRILEDKPWTSRIKISEGCDNKCAYCVIPSIRGGYRSRKSESIIEEAKLMARKGVRELILIGQDTTNYGKDFQGEEIDTFAKLIRQLCQIEGLKWIRTMYCYEDKIDEELINVIATEEKVCKYIDVPLQHISDSVLGGMKRKSTNASIKETLKKLREQVEDIHIRTTFIVGFPGETEEDYDQLYDFVAEEKFERLGVFAYSQEEGTVAGEMKNQIEEEIKEERKNSIMNLQMEISRERNEGKIGKIIEALIEEEDEEPLTYIGRSQFDAPEIDNEVIVKSDRKLKLGTFVMVKIEDAFDYDIVGTVV